MEQVNRSKVENGSANVIASFENKGKYEELVRQIEVIKIENSLLKKEMAEIKSCNDKMADSIFDLEVSLAKLAQYGRRENLQIQGIPMKVQQKDLEKYVIDLLSMIDVNVSSYNIVAWHRLYQYRNDKPADMIIRFVNRKDVVRCRKKQYKLKSIDIKGIQFVDNLCPEYRKLLSECNKLKRDGKISACWSYNGNIFVNLFELNARGTAIYHKDELYGMLDSEIESEHEYENENVETNRRSSRRSLYKKNIKI